MRAPILVFCALLVSGTAGAHQRDAAVSHSLTAPHKVTSLTQCDVSKITGDIKSILHYTYTMVTDSAWDMLDIAGNLIFCANNLLSWLCRSDDWQAQVDARWNQLQEVVSQFQQEVPTLWQQVVDEVKTCL